MPFLSIIIPTFNAAATISFAIYSVLQQTFTDFEILVIDGASNDDTLGIINNFNDHRIRIFSEKDNGIYDAMNKGIRLARGEWLYFLGSDDTLYHQDTLKKIERVLGLTNAKAVYGNVKMNGNSGWAKDGDIYDGPFDIKKLLVKNIAHQAIFYNNSLFKNHGYYNLKYNVCADYDFNLRTMSRYRFEYTNQVIAEFVAGGASTKNVDSQFQKELSKNLIQYFYRHLSAEHFFGLRHDIIKQGIRELKKLKVFKASKLLFIGGKFTAQHLLRRYLKL